MEKKKQPLRYLRREKKNVAGIKEQGKDIY
jgi:hypothetical protein